MLNAIENKPRMGWNRENISSIISELTYDNEVKERCELKKKSTLLTNEIWMS